MMLAMVLCSSALHGFPLSECTSQAGTQVWLKVHSSPITRTDEMLEGFECCNPFRSIITAQQQTHQDAGSRSAADDRDGCASVPL